MYWKTKVAKFCSGKTGQRNFRITIFKIGIDKGNLVMKKVIGILALVIACSGGGFLFVANKAQTAAEEIITEIERSIEKSIPGSDFTFGAVSADVFANAAQVSDLTVKLNGETLVTANSLVMSGDELILKRAEFTGVEGFSKSDSADLNFSIKSILLADTDIVSVYKLVDELKFNPVAVIEAFNDVYIGELDFRELSFTVDVKGEEVFNLNGGLQLSGIKNGEIQTLNMAGSLKDKHGELVGDAIDGSLTNINITGFDFGNLLTAVAMEDEQLLLAQLQKGFGIRVVSIDGLVANIDDELKASLTNGQIEIRDNVIKSITLNDFSFILEDEEVALDIGKAQFKGLDLGLDYSSEVAIIENSAQFYGLTDIGLNNVSFITEGEEFGISELSLEDVVFEDGLVVKSTINLNGIRIPTTLIAEMNRSVASYIENVTGSENFTLSLFQSSDLNTKDGRYDFKFDFGIEGFAEVKLNGALEGLDVVQLRKASKADDIFAATEIWGEVSKELSIAAISLEYIDDQLADIILAETPDVSQLVMMSGFQIDMVLGQYPDQANQLKASIKAFLEGKNSFKVSMNAQTPVKIMDIQQLFVSGDMANSITVAFEAN